MGFRVLSATDHADEWDGLVKCLARPDVHFTSAYGRVQETLGGKACLAVYDGQFGVIVQPFMLAAIPDTKYHDIKSMYGFGGPVAYGYSGDDFMTSTGWGAVGDDTHEFGERFYDWARASNVVSEYCALHPLYLEEQCIILRSQNLNIQFTKDVIVIENLSSLSLTKIKRRVAREVKRYQTTPVILTKQMPPDYMDKYNEAMEKLGAAPRWMFPARYWEAHGPEIGTEWFTCGGRQLLTIGVGETAYAHFMGGANGSKIDPLLYFEAAHALGTFGFKRFHLGGGITPGDSLEFFKSGFSDVRHKVGSYCRIFDKQLYHDLLHHKQDVEVRDHGRTSTQNWFPVYRREFA